MSPLRWLAALAVVAAQPAAAQLGKQQGLVEPNVASDSALLLVPHVTPAIVVALKAARPILSMVTLDSILAANSLTKQQRTDVYGKLFVHVDANRGSDAELLLVPGVGSARLLGLKRGRPWKTPDQLGVLEQYFFIPIELNSFTDEIMDSFAGIGVGTRQWKREFREYRPWTSMEQFEREIGKYLRARPQELKRLERYVIIAP